MDRPGTAPAAAHTARALVAIAVGTLLSVSVAVGAAFFTPAATSSGGENQGRGNGSVVEAPQVAPAIPAVPVPPPVPDLSWVPAGFTPFDPDFAYEFEDDPECSTSLVSCFGVRVASRSTCPTSIYVELQLLNARGDVVGFTNDLLPPLESGQVGLAQLETFDESIDSGNLSVIRCT